MLKQIQILEGGSIPAREARNWKIEETREEDYKKRKQKIVEWVRKGKFHGTERSMESRQRENAAGQRCVA